MNSHTPKLTHFHSGDPRFCGSNQQVRSFAMKDALVNCPRCKANDNEHVATVVAYLDTSNQSAKVNA